MKTTLTFKRLRRKYLTTYFLWKLLYFSTCSTRKHIANLEAWINKRVRKAAHKK